MKEIVVVGASLAGIRSCQNLRRNGFEGTLTLIGDEKHLPYDRPPLSKSMLTTAQNPQELFLVSEAEVRDLEIDLLLGERQQASTPSSRKSRWVRRRFTTKAW